MSTLAEVQAAVEGLPRTQQRALFDFLSERLNWSPVPREQSSQSSHGVLDIPAVDVGEILHPLSEDDDLLGEMLENRGMCFTGSTRVSW